MKHLSDIKKLNLFVFFTMFAKYSVDLFMPVILYKLNYSVFDILIFLMITFIINILTVIPITKIGRKYGYKYLVISSIFLFILLYFIVSFMKKGLFYFLSVALLSSISNILYYISRHNYASYVLNKNNTSKGVGGILTSTVLASIITSIFSSFMLEELPVYIIAIIIAVVYFAGVIFILSIKPINATNNNSLKDISKNINYRKKIFFMLEQFKVLFFILYPLYVYIYIDNTYTYIGLVYLVTGLASIIFIYFFSKIIDKGNINYLRLSSILLSIILFLDMYIKSKYLALIIVFLEGICIKLYDTSITNIMYLSRGDLEGSRYFLFMEIIYNIARIIIVAVLLIFNIKLRTALFICIIFILISGFIRMDTK